jgi:tetratricopeptide (TPR) repeat protein
VQESLKKLKKAFELSESGQHSAVIDYLSELPSSEVEDSPTLALLLGSAQARLGRRGEGERLVDLALARARDRGDHAVELRALNARGAIALVTGRVDEAEEFFTKGLNAAKRQNDHDTIGRCSNNLGILQHNRGQYDRALSSYTIALAAFQQVGSQHGVAEVEHNIGITYRDLGQLDRALQQAGQAYQAARVVGDRALEALTLAVQAEIRGLAGDPHLARREIEQALQIHRELEDEPKETGDIRILAGILAALGETDEAEILLRDVIDRAKQEERPKMLGDAGRDMARLLVQVGRADEATEFAREARVVYNEYGAEAEVKKLDELIGQLTS